MKIRFLLLALLVSGSQCQPEPGPQTPLIIASTEEPKGKIQMICRAVYSEADKEIPQPQPLIDYYKKHPAGGGSTHKYELIKKYYKLWNEQYKSLIGGSEIKLFLAEPLSDQVILDAKLNLDPKIQVIITASPFPRDQSNIAVGDFAADEIGGGTLTTGFVQEEIMMLESTFLLWVAEARGGSAKGLSWCPQISLFDLSKNPRVMKFRRFLTVKGIYGGSKLQAINPPSAAQDHLVLAPKAADIYVFAMAAKYYNKGATYTENDLRDMILLAARAFYETMLALDFDGHPLEIHSGHWGAGAFNGSRHTAYIMQRIAVDIAYQLFKAATGKDPGVRYFHDSFDGPGKADVDAARAIFDAQFKAGITTGDGIKKLHGLTQSDSNFQVQK